jgi:hypothetical protein
MARLTINVFAFLLIIGFSSLMFQSCYYDKADIRPTPCDTTSTFNSRIAPLVASQCATPSCHASASSGGGIVLNTYTDIQAIALDGSFVGCVNGAGYSLMPKGTSGLSTCDKDAIAKWVNAGAPNN